MNRNFYDIAVHVNEIGETEAARAKWRILTAINEDSRIKESAFRVAFYIIKRLYHLPFESDFATGTKIVSRDEIAQDLSISLSTVARAIKQLRELGYLIVKSQRGNCSWGPHLANEYTIDWRKWAKKEDQ